MEKNCGERSASRWVERDLEEYLKRRSRLFSHFSGKFVPFV
jgi:hypothetical protein